MIRLLSLVPAFGLLAAHAFGQDPPATEGTAARVEVSNALVKALKSSKQVSFRLKWNYLPKGKASDSYIFPSVTSDRNRTLSKPGVDKDLTASSITFSNAVLMNDEAITAWDARMQSSPSYQFFLKSLSAGGSPTNLRDALQKGFQFWTQASIAHQLDWNNLSGVPARQWSNWVRARRDFFALYYLLGGSTTGPFDPRPFGVLLTPTVTPRGKPTLAYREDCEWTIVAEPATAQDLAMGEKGFYRFYVSVTTPTVSQLFNTTKDTEVTYGLRAGLLQRRKDLYIMEPATIPVDGDSGPIPLDAVVPESAGLNEDTNTSTQSVGFLTLGTLSNVTAPGLLEGVFTSGSARPFVGGLVGNGVATTIYGLNYPLDEFETFGLLYGIVPKADNAFYFGPSLHFGIFDLSVGARVFGRADGTTSARFAGALSVDLASVFSKPKPPMELKPKASTGWLWTDIDDLATNHGLAILEAVGSRLTSEDLNKNPALQFSVAVGDKTKVIKVRVKKNASGPIVLGGSLGTGDQISRHLAATAQGTDYTITAPEGFMVRKVEPDSTAADIEQLTDAGFRRDVKFRVLPGEARIFRFVVRKGDPPAPPGSP